MAGTWGIMWDNLMCLTKVDSLGGTSARVAHKRRHISVWKMTRFDSVHILKASTLMFRHCAFFKSSLKRPWTFFLRVGIENVENQTFSLLISIFIYLKFSRYQANHRILAELSNIRTAPRNGLLVT